MADIVPGLGSPPPDASPALDFVPESPPASSFSDEDDMHGRPPGAYRAGEALDFVPECCGDGNSEDDDDMHSHRHTTPPWSPTPTTINTVDLLHMGVPFMYRIPSFPVIHVTLWQILFEGTDEHDLPTKYDVFLQDSASLSSSLPHTIDITNWCFIPVSYCTAN